MVDTWACPFWDLGRRRSAPRRRASRPAGDAHHEAAEAGYCVSWPQTRDLSKVVPDIRPKIAVGRLGRADDVLSPLLPNGVAKNENNSGQQRQINPGRNPSDTKNENNSG